MTRLYATACLFIAAVVAANVLTAHYGLVPAGLGLMVTAGTYAAGFALLARDLLHRAADTQLGHHRAVAVVMGLIVLSAALSALLAPPALALASGLAFLAAETADLLVFLPVRERAGFAWAALASNVVAAPVDTLLFLAIAGFPVTAEAVGGQLWAKLVYATLVPLTVWVIVHRQRAARASAA